MMRISSLLSDGENGKDGERKDSTTQIPALQNTSSLPIKSSTIPTMSITPEKRLQSLSNTGISSIPKLYMPSRSKVVQSAQMRKSMSPMAVSSLINSTASASSSPPPPPLPQAEPQLEAEIQPEVQVQTKTQPSGTATDSILISPNPISSSIPNPVIKETAPLASIVKTPKKKALTPNTNTNLEGRSISNDTPKNIVDKEKEKDKDKESGNEPTIIDIEIPLSTHNDVHAEFNFSKLVEEKYGKYDAPQSALSKSLWNLVDEDDEGEGDDDEIYNDHDNEEEDADIVETDTTTNNGNSETSNFNSNAYDDEDEIVRALKIKFAPGMSDMEKESLVLKEIHRRKMENNKRIGKYDVDDPFIDDEELEFEEKVNANADGWFIWYGKLESSKKKESKIKSVPLKTEKSPKIVKPITLTSTPMNNTTSSGRSKNSSSQAPAPKRRKKQLTTAAAPSVTTSVSSNSTAPASSTEKASPITQPPQTADPAPVKEKASTPNNSSNAVPASNIIIGSFGF